MDEAKLDLKDRKILKELDINARQKFQDIARKLKTSKEVIFYRVKNLEKSGIIKGYYTTIDFSKLGFKNIRVYLKMQKLSPQKNKEIIDFLVNHKNTFEVITAYGNWDIVFTVLVKELKDFFDIWDKFQGLYKLYIHEKNISLFYEYVHYRKNYILPNYSETLTGDITGGSKAGDVDKTDLKIINYIAPNARISFNSLSPLVGISAKAVKYRIKNLEKKGVILNYRPIIDMKKFGYQFYKIDIELEDLSVKKGLQQFAKNHPNVVAEDRVIGGGSDFEFDCEFESMTEFLKLIEQIQKEFSTAIRTIKYYTATEFHKILYTPKVLE